MGVHTALQLIKKPIRQLFSQEPLEPSEFYKIMELAKAGGFEVKGEYLGPKCQKEFSTSDWGTMLIKQYLCRGVRLGKGEESIIICRNDESGWQISHLFYHGERIRGMPAKCEYHGHGAIAKPLSPGCFESGYVETTTEEIKKLLSPS